MITLEVDDWWFSLKYFVTCSKESPAHRDGLECMSEICNSLEFLKWDAGYPWFTRTNPSMEDREEVGLFRRFQPDSFVDSIKIKTKDGFLCIIFPIELLEFLFGNEVVIVDLICREDIVYSCRLTKMSTYTSKRYRKNLISSSRSNHVVGEFVRG